MREDIKAIPVMIAAGWEVEYSETDKRYGRIDVTKDEKFPQDGIGFKKGDMRVWQAIKGNDICWRYADLIDGHYTNHRWITIEEAVKL